MATAQVYVMAPTSVVWEWEVLELCENTLKVATASQWEIATMQGRHSAQVGSRCNEHGMK